ncbi:TetR/AcrR family transcriptional regulator [Streptomyces sp. NPDC057074]|uniref:TetR/AcrR family transcriptional regulator n=1 Tax=Streptomyces sp. NPDC057074 TaxID=3346015 RepID=UPI003639BA20
MDDKTSNAGSARRRRDSAATREALLSAAHGRFIRLGYDRTTLRDVAADAAVNVALVKRYFGSKEGLFKAALAANPRFLAPDERFPYGVEELTAALARHLSADAWPEYGEHPVLMLLRAPENEEVSDMRRASLDGAARRILAAAGEALPPGGATEQQLRSQLVVALGVGVAVLRSAVGVQPLGDAAPDALAPLLRLALKALLEEPRDDSGR